MNRDNTEALAADLKARYRRQLQREAEIGDGRHGRKVFLAMLKALEELPAKRFEPGDGAVWVWSDLHLGHANVIRYCNRPFADAAQMDRQLYANWEATVAPQDQLICVGDVAMRDALCEATWRRIRGAAGRRKQLVIGNHDLTGAGHLRVAGFDDICSLLWADGDPPLLFTHEPLVEVPPGWVNVHGHTHAAPLTRTPHINVSVEQIDYRPLALTAVRALAAELVQGRYPEGETTLERVASLAGTSAAA